jgi:hypothetical protein
MLKHPADYTDEEWEALWKGPTQWEVDQAIRRQALDHERDEQRALVADYRARHPEVGPHVKDEVVLALVSLEAIGGRTAPW